MADRRTFLSVSAAAAVAAPVVGATAAAAPRTFGGPGRREHPQRPDRELRALLREIDARRIGATVTRLAAFGTRHTLSSQTEFGVRAVDTSGHRSPATAPCASS